jgi:enamine deaminase RidA (YjgF/YER057c/UK114 family)
VSDPYERMKASGVELPPSPRPAGSYAPGKIFGRLVFASGQTPTRDGVPAYRGRVGTDLAVEEAYAAARLAALNCLQNWRRCVATCGAWRAS